jgi:ribokinase
MTLLPVPLAARLKSLFAILRASARRRFDVLGLGEISHDLVLQLAPGVALAAALPDKLSAQAMTTLGGGQIATALVAAQRLGLRTALVGAVGDDAAGREQLAELSAEGVDHRGVAVCAGAQTRLALILVDAQGDRRVLEWRHPRLQPPAEAPTRATLEACRILHVDGTYPLAAVAAARRAKAAGTLVSLDLDRVPGESRSALGELVALADLCVVCARFPGELTGEADPDRAALLLAERTAGLVVVTRGEAGGVAVVDAELRPFPALPPPALVDTTACGDTFHAALLTHLLACADQPPAAAAAQLFSALRFASTAAALKCQDLGRRGCPRRLEVEALLAALPATAFPSH